MTAKTPIRTVFTGATATGLAEYQTGEFIPLANGGLGAALSIGSAGQVLKVNSGGTAVEFGAVPVADIDSATDLTSATIAGADLLLISDGGTEGKATFDQVATFVQTTSDTDDISEGSTNQYFTTARARSAFSAGTGISISSGEISTTITQYADSDARGAISVTDSGGDGSLAYNSSTGVITYTGPSAAEVRAHISGGTGVTVTSGSIAIGQAVGTGDDVTFNSVAGDLTGDVTGNVTGNVTGTVSSVSNHDTDDISEGATNLYYTDARSRGAISVTDSGGDGSLAYNNTTGVITYTGPSASEVRAHISAGTGISITDGEISTTITQYADSDARGAISVTDSGGDGSLAYNSSTGVLTYTGPSASEVRAHISGGTGVTITDGEIAIGQAVATNSNVQFNNAVIDGNLTVNGTTVTNSATNTTIEDALIELGSGNSGANSNDLGLILERGSTGDNGFIGFDESEDKFIVGTTTATGASSGGLTITKGTLLANIEGNVTGTVSDVSNHDTDDISEGSTNLYYTDARSRGAISVTDSGGDGSLAYNSSTGVITYTGPSASEVRAHISAGTGISITDGEISTTITQYADSDARGAISVTDSGGDGSLAYNSSTGVITYTGPSASEVRAHISAGTGVTITDGEIAIGQAVATNSNVQFNNVTIDGTLDCGVLT